MSVKLRVEELPLGFGFRAINDNEYDGAEDAGPQMVGEGKTEAEAREDFWQQWLEREAERDTKRAIAQAKHWDSFFERLLGRPR